MTQPDLFRNTEFPRDLAQCALAYDRRAQLGQFTLRQIRIMREQVVRCNEAQYGICLLYTSRCV